MTGTVVARVMEETRGASILTTQCKNLEEMSSMIQMPLMPIGRPKML